MAGTFFFFLFSGLLAPRGDSKTQEKNRTPLERTQHVYLQFRYITGDCVVAEVGIAYGSRAEFVVGI